MRVQELVDLGLVAGVDAGRQAEVAGVGQVERLVDRVDRRDGDERQEQLVLEEAMVGGQVGDDGRRDEVAVVEARRRSGARRRRRLDRHGAPRQRRSRSGPGHAG